MSESPKNNPAITKNFDALEIPNGTAGLAVIENWLKEVHLQDNNLKHLIEISDPNNQGIVVVYRAMYDNGQLSYGYKTKSNSGGYTHTKIPQSPERSGYPLRQVAGDLLVARVNGKTIEFKSEPQVEA